jgi:hypothetical protein
MHSPAAVRPRSHVACTHGKGQSQQPQISKPRRRCCKGIAAATGFPCPNCLCQPCPPARTYLAARAPRHSRAAAPPAAPHPLPQCPLAPPADGSRCRSSLQQSEGSRQAAQHSSWANRVLGEEAFKEDAKRWKAGPHLACTQAKQARLAVQHRGTAPPTHPAVAAPAAAPPPAVPCRCRWLRRHHRLAGPLLQGMPQQRCWLACPAPQRRPADACTQARGIGGVGEVEEQRFVVSRTAVHTKPAGKTLQRRCKRLPGSSRRRPPPLAVHMHCAHLSCPEYLKTLHP